MSRRDAKAGRGARGSRRLATWVGAVTGLALIGAVAAWLLLRPPVGAPPEPPVTATLDASVRDLIAQSLAEVRARPRDAKAWEKLGLVYDVNAVPDAALQCLEQAVLLAPRDARAWFHLGRARARLMDAKGAAEAFARSAELDPLQPHAHWRRGFALLDLEDLDGAEAAFARAVKVDRGNLPGTAGLARVALARGDGERAEKLVRPLVQARPKDASLRFLLGSALRLQGRMDEAEPELAAGSAASTSWHDPWERDALKYQVSTFGMVTQALAAAADGRPDVAISILEPVLRREPDTASVVVNLATQYVAAGRPADAIRLLGPFVQRHPDHATAHAALAEAAVSAQDGELALRHAERAAELDPKLERLHDLRAGALTYLGRDAEALAEFQLARRENPLDANLAYGVGATHSKLGNPQEGAERLKEAVTLDPRHGRAWLALAITQAQLGQFDHAEASVRQAALHGGLPQGSLEQALQELRAQRRRAGR